MTGNIGMLAAPFAAFCAVASMPTQPLFAQQTAAALPYHGVVEAVVGGSRKPLERQTVRMRINSGVMQIGSGSMFYELDGASSPVRFQAGQALNFVMRSPGEGVDPSSMFMLYKAEIKKKKLRRVKISHSSFSQRMTVDMDQEAIPLSFEHKKGGLVELRSQTPLQKGEYVFVSMATNAFAFGVD